MFIWQNSLSQQLRSCHLLPGTALTKFFIQRSLISSLKLIKFHINTLADYCYSNAKRLGQNTQNTAFLIRNSTNNEISLVHEREKRGRAPWALPRKFLQLLEKISKHTYTHTRHRKTHAHTNKCPHTQTIPCRSKEIQIYYVRSSRCNMLSTEAEHHRSCLN